MSKEKGLVQSPKLPKAKKQKRMKKDFSTDDAVLVYNHDVIYDAKIQRVKQLEGKAQTKLYYVHYNGWRKQFDEWVPGDRLLEDNKDNQALKKKFMEEIANRSKKRKSKVVKTQKENAEETDENQDGNAKAKKSKTDLDLDALIKSQGRDEYRIKVPLPLVLKKLLVNDWENMTQKRKLIKLPKTMTVSVILDDFYDHLKKKKLDKTSEEQLLVILEGIRCYFDAAVGTLLLYHFERLQFEALFEDEETKDLDFCDIYGAEHLIRLFVKLPLLFEHVELEKSNHSFFQSKTQELLKFLIKHKDKYFNGAFKASEEYEREYEAVGMKQNVTVDKP